MLKRVYGALLNIQFSKKVKSGQVVLEHADDFVEACQNLDNIQVQLIGSSKLDCKYAEESRIGAVKIKDTL